MKSAEVRQMSDEEQWVRGPALEILVVLRMIQNGDVIEQTPNKGNMAHRNPPRVDVVKYADDTLNYYKDSLEGPYYPSGWSLTGWRRPKKERSQ